MARLILKTAIVLMSFSLTACSNTENQTDKEPRAVALAQQWTVTGLDSPESVALSADGRFLYVSNVGGEGTDRDGNGYISKISTDGVVIEQKWAHGLDAPKGLALDGGQLYVSDIDRLVAIDAATGKIDNIYPVEGAGFLNDVAKTRVGILVSDSATGRIFRLENGIVTEFANDPRLAGINGLLEHDGHLLITTMEGGELLSLGMDNQMLIGIASGMKNADGIAVLKNGDYLASAWPGQIFHVSKTGETTVILDTQDANVFQNDILLMGDKLLVPNWQPGSLTAYTVE